MQSRSDFPWKHTHVDDTALVQSGPGALHSIVVNGLTTAGDITVYDGVDATGTVIAVLHLSTQPPRCQYSLSHSCTTWN